MNEYHLGINMGHARSAAVVRDGEIVVAIEQERLDRKKHSIGFLLTNTLVELSTQFFIFYIQDFLQEHYMIVDY